MIVNDQDRRHILSVSCNRTFLFRASPEIDLGESPDVCGASSFYLRSETEGGVVRKWVQVICEGMAAASAQVSPLGLIALGMVSTPADRAKTALADSGRGPTQRAARRRTPQLVDDRRPLPSNR